MYLKMPKSRENTEKPPTIGADIYWRIISGTRKGCMKI